MLTRVDRGTEADSRFLSHEELAGATTPITVGGPPKTVLRLRDVGQAPAIPDGMRLALSYTIPGTWLAWNGRLRVSAIIRWGSGSGRHEIQIDIPAFGTSFAVPGGDTVEVQMWAWGTAGIGGVPPVLNASATLCFGGASNARPCQQTLIHTCPADSGTRLRMPAFASGVRISTNNVAALPATLLTFWDSLAPVAGNELLLVAPAHGVLYPIPASAFAFDIICAAAATFYSVWEIQP